MPNLKSRLPQIILLLVGILYVIILAKNWNEKTRRSLQLHADARTADNVRVSMRILSADLNNGEIVVSMGFELKGNLALDAATPAVDLNLLLNTSRGAQEVDFPKGRRVNAVDAVFKMTGDSDGYPFDRHTASMGIRMVALRQPTQSPAVTGDATGQGSSALEQSTSVPIEVDFSASVPGVMFQKTTKRGTSEIGFLKDDLAIITLYMRRADNVIVTSIIVSIVMLGLATGVLAMVLQATVRGKESALLPLSLSVSLIFGLPALRNLQPSVPPVGALCDYVAFMWAEVIVAGSTIVVVWAWFFKSRAREAEEAKKMKSSK